MTNVPRCHRPGFTLIEMLITITIGSSIMVTSVALLHRSFELHKLAQNRVQREHLLDRFIQQFRRDVYAAVDVEILPTSGLSLESAAQDQIVYSALGKQLTRELPRQGGLRHTVDLGPSKAASFEVTEDGRRVILIVRHELESSIQYERRRIEVTIGRIANAIARSDGVPAEGRNENQPTR